MAAKARRVTGREFGPVLDRKAKPKFEVDWGEENKETKVEETKKEDPKTEDTKPEKKTKRQLWLEKLKGKEEKKDKVGFEVE